MRLLVVGLNYEPEATGIAPYTAALCRGFVERGHRVRVLTAMPHYPEWKVRPGYAGWSCAERLQGVTVKRLRHYVPKRPSGVRRLVSEISFGIRVLGARWVRPDLIIFVSPGLFATVIGMLRARAYRIPAVVWVQDVYSLGIVETAGEQHGGFVARVITAVESWMLSNAAGAAVIHDRFAAVAKRLGAPPSAIKVIRNWTHLPARVPESQELARARWGVRPDRVVALYSGAMGVKQDLDNVIAAARLAEEHGSDVVFVLMGDGGERQRLERLAAGVSAVRFLDPLPGDAYQSALEAADVLIVNEHAGLREMAVPSKLTSYFSSGRPIIAATDAGSVTAEEIAASGAGLRVDAGDPRALLRAVLELQADPDRALRLGQSGLEYRKAVLDQDAAIDAFERWLLTVRERLLPR